MRDPEVWGRLVRINENMRVEFYFLEEAHFQNTGIRDHVLDTWDELIRDELEFTLANSQNFIQRWANKGIEEYRLYMTNQLVVKFIQALLSMLNDSNALRFNLDDLPGDRCPTDPEDPDDPDNPEDQSSG
jgi:hypothetical protein